MNQMRAQSVLLGLSVTVVAWFAAFAIEHATRMMFNVYSRFGADLPSWTLLTRDLVRFYLPWLLAAASTVALLWLWRRKSAYYVHACAMVAVTVAFLASFTALSLVMPLMKCSFQWWPEWAYSAPGAGKSGDQTAGADASRECS